ncbi:LysM domain-containing protein [Cordyceps javanica]|uniref:LysM domain-containing protein n=1 Tax=Cordyceps javanica TaxID=43265 RepID=A0A545WDB8_9HYPO|nr:LysM domain-containing protein [Cordyceps javanica]TQW11984.1 LysM domain protein [Cordyceps javanica]
MRVASLAVALSVVVAAAAAYEHPSKVRRGATPDGKVPPGTTDQCTYYFTTTSKDDTCSFIEGYWGISHKDFVAWNPAVKDDCSGIEIGYSYCVDVNNGGTITSPPTSTLPPAPSPTLDGIAKDCDKFHLIVKGDTCDSVTQKYGISMDQFTAWNKAVDKDCGGFWAAYYCCVHVAGAGTSSPGTPTTTSDPVPSPHQTGIAKDCDKYYKVEKGDTCDSVTGKFGISAGQLLKWNTAIDKDCNGFWAGYYICVHAAGATTTSPGSTPTSDPVPSPHQTGITKDCDKYYQVVKGDTCDSVTDKFGISRDQLTKWNTAIDKDCNGFWAGYYICVKTKGFKPTSTTGRPTSTGPTAPGPTQTGITKDCHDWYIAKTGDYCDKIVQGYSNFDKATFIKWNPAVGKDCSGIWVKYAYCVGTKSKPAKPVKPPTQCTTKHPEPTQPGAICKCKKWHLMKDGDNCWSLAQKYKVSENDIKKWNPGTNCNLWAKYNVCVGA